MRPAKSVLGSQEGSGYEEEEERLRPARGIEAEIAFRGRFGPIPLPPRMVFRVSESENRT